MAASSSLALLEPHYLIKTILELMQSAFAYDHRVIRSADDWLRRHRCSQSIPLLNLQSSEL